MDTHRWEIRAAADEYGESRLVIVAGSWLVFWLRSDELAVALEMCDWRNDVIERARALEAAA